MGENDKNVWKNEALRLLLNVSNIDVNSSTDFGETALHCAVRGNSDFETFNKLLNVSNIDVNIVKNYVSHWTALHLAVHYNNIEALKLVLSHPNLTALTLNHRDKIEGDTPVMLALPYQWEYVTVLTSEPKVDLDTTVKWYGARSAEEYVEQYMEFKWVFSG